MCININIQKRLEFTVLSMLKSPCNLVNAEFLRQSVLEKGFTSDLATSIIDRLNARGWVQSVTSKRTNQVFAYRITVPGYQAMRRTARQLGIQK